MNPPSQTSGAPAWVSYTALVIAAAAALFSAGSLRVAYLSYRASGARVVLKMDHPLSVVPGESVKAGLTVVNMGRGEVDIIAFHLTLYGKSKTPVQRVESIEGDPLPARLSGNSRKSWDVDVLPALKEFSARLHSGRVKPKSSWPDQVHLSVELGDGRIVAARPKYSADGIIASAFPG